MPAEINNLQFVLFVASALLTIFLLRYILKKKPVTQIQKFLAYILLCVLIIYVGLTAQRYFVIEFNTNPIYFENFIYIGTCLVPVMFFLLASSFVNTKIKFTKKYALLLVIPIISLLILFTNEYHHLFYKHYSFNFTEMEYGPYMNVHLIYTYGLFIISALMMLNHAAKTSGFFSKQSIFIVIGVSIPAIINILGIFNIIDMTVYMTPISFSLAVFFFTLAIFKFDFLSITPIALEKIVDRMSDSYIVLNDRNIIIDFNKSFLTTFKVKDSQIRNINVFDWDKSVHLPKLKKSLQSVSVSPKTVTFETYVDTINRYFNVEISSIVNKNIFLGTMILFKDITQHMKDLKTIKSNQDILIEKERFASLGQMIGGIAHNLKTPIMSISGAAEALTDLVKEYDSSIGDPEVTNEDHHDIARDMASWISKIKTHTSYMSDVITAVKGQAVERTDNVASDFTLEELIKRITILMKHELKNALIELNINLKVDSGFILHGDVNSLVQVMNNLISNAIQSYNGAPDNKIDLIVQKKNDSIVLSVRDYGCGMSKEVQDKLFKEMITTKGKNGTGLGLFISYSNIKAHFNGSITFKSELNKGTTFSVILPL